MGKRSKEAEKWRHRLESEYDLGDTYGAMMLEQILDAYEQMRKAQRIVERDGLTFQDRFGQVKNHPLLTTIRDCRSQVFQGLKQLGLDQEAIPNPGPGRPPGK